MGTIINDKLYSEVSNELDVSEHLVKSIVDSQSKFTKEKIKLGAFESVTYVYLGKIKARLRMVQKINDVLGKQLDKLK